jgi:hypothetical protein
MYKCEIVNDEYVKYKEMNKEEIIEGIETGEIVLMNIENKENEEKSQEEKDKQEFEKDLKIGKLSENEERQLRELIEEFKDIIAISTSTLEKSNIVKHRIDTGNHEPIARKAYREDEVKRKVVKEEVEKMFKQGVIRESYGPWSFPITIVGKKNGTKDFV